MKTTLYDTKSNAHQVWVLQQKTTAELDAATTKIKLKFYEKTNTNTK